MASVKNTTAATLLLALLLAACQAQAALYTTWQGVEADKCATAWLIQRFGDKEAQFKMIPKGELVREGVPFDTPQGELKVSHRSTTYEAALKKFNLKEPALLQIALLVRDIEMNQWEKTPLPESAGIKAIIYGISAQEGETMEAIRKSFPIFDYLYEYYKKLEK